MPDLLVAADEAGATELVHDAEATLGTITRSGNGTLGPFNASWNASASFTGGNVDLIAPNVVRLAGVTMNFTVAFSFSFDLSTIIPDFCLPQICVRIPFIGRVCTPRICIDWPTVPVAGISHSGSVTFTSDFSLDMHLDGTEWVLDLLIVGVPFLAIDAVSAAILVALGLAVSAALVGIPFIGPFLAGAVALVVAAIGIAGVTGLLGPILSLFVSGLRFELYRRQQIFEVLPAVLPLDPAVNIRLDNITASVQSTDEDELVLAVDIS